MKHSIIVVLILLLSACTSSRGFDRGELRSQLSENKVVTEEDIQKVLELRAQLPQPFKLGIYFSPLSNAEWRYRNSWNWLGKDKDILMGLRKDLKEKDIASDVIIINDSIVEGHDIKSIRLAGARTGVDSVLIVNGVSDIDRYNNSLGVTYALLVTPFFIPGTEADSLFMVNASMWDVRNQFLYLSIESEGTAHQSDPAFFIEETALIKKAKADALTSLKGEISDRLELMARN